MYLIIFTLQTGIYRERSFWVILVISIAFLSFIGPHSQLSSKASTTQIRTWVHLVTGRCANHCAIRWPGISGLTQSQKLGVRHTTCNARQLWSIRSQKRGNTQLCPMIEKRLHHGCIKRIREAWCFHSAITVNKSCQDQASWMQKWDA